MTMPNTHVSRKCLMVTSWSPRRIRRKFGRWYASPAPKTRVPQRVVALKIPPGGLDTGDGWGPPWRRRAMSSARVVTAATIVLGGVLALTASMPQTPPAPASQTPPRAGEPPQAGAPEVPARGRAGGGRGGPGATLYAENCAGCHGTDLSGGRTRSLFDEKWLERDDRREARVGDPARCAQHRDDAV